MKTPSWFVACGLVLLLDVAHEGQHRDRHDVGAESITRALEPTTAAANPVTPFFAASARFSTASWMVWTKRARLRRLPYGDRQFPALAGQRGSEVSAPSAPAAVESGCRRSAVPRRSMPMTSGSTASSASDFSNLRRERPRPDHVPAATQHPADRPGDQRAVGGDRSGRVAQRANRERRHPDRAGSRHPVAPWTERRRRLPVGRPLLDAPRAGVRGADQPRADPVRATATTARRSVVVSAGVVHERPCARLVGRRPRGHGAVAGSR